MSKKDVIIESENILLSGIKPQKTLKKVKNYIAKWKNVKKISPTKEHIIPEASSEKWNGYTANFSAIQTNGEKITIYVSGLMINASRLLSKKDKRINFNERTFISRTPSIKFIVHGKTEEGCNKIIERLEKYVEDNFSKNTMGEIYRDSQCIEKKI